MMQEDPEDAFLPYAIALEYVKINDWQAAKNGFESALAIQQDYLPVYYHFGKLYEQLQEIDNAINCYGKGMIIAKQQRNNHTLAELQGAMMAINEDYDPDDE